MSDISNQILLISSCLKLISGQDIPETWMVVSEVGCCQLLPLLGLEYIPWQLIQKMQPRCQSVCTWNTKNHKYTTSCSIQFHGMQKLDNMVWSLDNKTLKRLDIQSTTFKLSWKTMNYETNRMMNEITALWLGHIICSSQEILGVLRSREQLKLYLV